MCVSNRFQGGAATALNQTVRPTKLAHLGPYKPRRGIWVLFPMYWAASEESEMVCDLINIFKRSL